MVPYHRRRRLAPPLLRLHRHRPRCFPQPQLPRMRRARTLEASSCPSLSMMTTQYNMMTQYHNQECSSRRSTRPKASGAVVEQLPEEVSTDNAHVVLTLPPPPRTSCRDGPHHYSLLGRRRRRCTGYTTGKRYDDDDDDDDDDDANNRDGVLARENEASIAVVVVVEHSVDVETTPATFISF